MSLPLPLPIAIPCTGRSDDRFCNGVSFTGEGKTSSKGNWLRTEKAEAALSHIGVAGCASRVSGAHCSVSVTHRFLRRGLFFNRTFLSDKGNLRESVASCGPEWL